MCRTYLHSVDKSTFPLSWYGENANEVHIMRIAIKIGPGMAVAKLKTDTYI